MARLQEIGTAYAIRFVTLFTTSHDGNGAVSVNAVFFAKGASVLPDHAHFLPSKSGILNRHAEQHVLVLLIVGGKGVLVEQHQFRIIRAGFCELCELLPDGCDQAGPLYIRSSSVIVL